MSFMSAGADCSANNNPLAQFSKHTQQDRSLQRQANNGLNVPQQAGLKNEMMMNQMDRESMDQFLNNGTANTNVFQFQPMRHELSMIHNGNSQQNFHAPQAQNWTNDFKMNAQEPVMNQTGPMAAKSNWLNDFQSASPQPMMDQPMMDQQQPGNMNYTMRNGYQPMRMMNNYGMGMNMQMNQSSQQLNVNEQQMNEPKIEWEDQFKEIERSMVEEPKETEDAEVKEETPEIVIDDKYNATFEDVWDNLNTEAMEQEFINEQYEEPSWEKDFATYATTRAHYGQYKFEKENQFLNVDDPYSIGMRLMENGAKLSEAALAFEAAVQQNENHTDAWLKLGEVQTQNEKEIAGISALEKCLQLDVNNLSASMTLAVSYINEGYDNAAFSTLERWIETKYPAIAEKARLSNPKITEDRYTLSKRVTELFLEAAQLSPNGVNIDADVQMGLGVLFYANEEFDKTIDCFKAALQVRPDDALLWNRLGASLANSNRSEEAVDAYFRALQLKPAFVRARYNLGVSCINIGCYKEAVEHLLGGLSMHKVEGMEDDSSISNQSTSLLETLKRAFIAMDRRDLLEMVKPGMNLDQFRGEFDF